MEKFGCRIINANFYSTLENKVKDFLQLHPTDIEIQSITFHPEIIGASVFIVYKLK